MKTLLTLTAPFVLAASIGCTSSAPPTQPPAASTARKGAPVATGNEGSATAAVDATPGCRLTVAEPMFNTLQLRSADGSCKLLLPAQVAPGRLALKVAAGSEGSAASLEVAAPGGSAPLFATEGQVTIEAVAGGHLRGSFEGRDANPPGVGPVRGTFDVSLPSH